MKHNPCVCVGKRSSQMRMEMKAISCSLARMCVTVSVARGLSLRAPWKKNRESTQPPLAPLKTSTDNPLFCFLNQVLQPSSTAPSSHPSNKNPDLSDFSGLQKRYYAAITCLEHAAIPARRLLLTYTYQCCFSHTEQRISLCCCHISSSVMRVHLGLSSIVVKFNSVESLQSHYWEGKHLLNGHISLSEP